MVLWVDGFRLKPASNQHSENNASGEASRPELSPVPSLQALYDASPHLLDRAHRLATRKKVTPAPRGVLYARQKEYVVSWAGARFSDGTPVQICGTEDVLTCHVIVLHHTFTRTTALAHFDEYVRDRGLNRFVDAFLDRVRRNHFYDDEMSSGSDGDAAAGAGAWEWEECEDSEEDEVDNIGKQG
jgi:hypothetical protein